MHPEAADPACASVPGSRGNAPLDAHARPPSRLAPRQNHARSSCPRARDRDSNDRNGRKWNSCTSSTGIRKEGNSPDPGPNGCPAGRDSSVMQHEWGVSPLHSTVLTTSTIDYTTGTVVGGGFSSWTVRGESHASGWEVVNSTYRPGT